MAGERYRRMRVEELGHGALVLESGEKNNLVLSPLGGWPTSLPNALATIGIARRSGLLDVQVPVSGAQLDAIVNWIASLRGHG